MGMPRLLLFPSVPILCPACGQTFEAPPPPPDPVVDLPTAGVERIAVTVARAIVASIRRDHAARPTPPPAPQSGDLTICHHCGDVLQFTDIETVVVMPVDVWSALLENERDQLRRLQYRMRLTKDVLGPAREAVAAGAGHDCDEWWRNDGRCALCGRQRTYEG
jgi:hypothetical protein